MFLKLYIYLNFAASVFIYTNAETSSGETNGKCILPNHPPNGKWEIIEGSDDAQPGSTVPSATAITFICDVPYQLLGDYKVITCLGKDWNLPPPQCISGEATSKVKRAVLLADTYDQEYYQNPSQRGGGGRGGDGVVIESGGRRTVIGPGEEGTPYYGQGVARGGEGGVGIIRGGIQIGGGGRESSGYNGNTGQRRGGQGSSGWNGNTGQSGGQGSSGRNGNTGQRGGGVGQTYYQDGQDGLVIGPGDTVNGYGVGIGAPGRNGQRKSGNGVVVDGGRVNGGVIGLGGSGGYPSYNLGSRSAFGSETGSGSGGAGVVIRGGRIHGNIVGVGGRGGSSRYYRRKRETTCPSLYSSQVTKVSCYDTDWKVTSCDSATNGIIALFKCEPHHHIMSKKSGISYCFYGEWLKSPEQQKCVPGEPADFHGFRRKREALNAPIIPACGEKIVSTDPSSTKKMIHYPWATAIYKNMSGAFTYICAGTMLTQRIIVTVAHCVTNESGGEQPAKEFKIAVGKYYQDYNDRRDTTVQYSDITKVLVHPNYRGVAQRFHSDIAVLITKDQLVLSTVVQPVCYQNLPNIHPSNGEEGVLTGWGFQESTSGSVSKEVQGIPIPFREDSTCLRELPPDFTTNYYVHDKMCAGYNNKSLNFCNGISGNGLAFPYKGRYYLHGIIALGVKDHNKDICAIEARTSLYTKISSHYDWLERLISQYK